MGLFKSLWYCGSQENVTKEKKIRGNSLPVIQMEELEWDSGNQAHTLIQATC